MLKTPLPYQLKAVDLMVRFLSLNRTKSVYNGSDPGLGKSLMTVLTCQKMGFKRVLVIAPRSVCRTWKREFEELPTSYTNVYVVEKPSELAEAFKSQVVVVSYSQISKVTPLLLKKGVFDCMVMDEAHFLSNPKSERSKIVYKELWNKIPHKIALSGTPYRTSIMDCYPMFSRMSHTPLPNYHAFGSLFSHPRQTGWGIKYEGVRNVEEFNVMLKKNFFVRSSKLKVLKELPEKRFSKILMPPKYSTKEYEDKLKELLEREEGVDLSPETLNLLNTIPEHLMGLLRLQGELKVPFIVEYVEELLEQNIPVILFAVNKSVITLYKEALNAYKPVVITGESSASERQSAVDNFQKGDTNLFIGNIQAAGTGISLPRAEYVIFGQMNYSPGDMSQASDRAHRLTTKHPIQVVYFVVENSLDERVSDVLMQRTRDFSKIL